MLKRLADSRGLLRTLVMAGFITSTLSISSGYAQENRNSQSRGRGTGGFDQQAPAIGQPLPNVKLYTAEGKEFSTSQLKGSYTVLVFGCLT
jgi:cytochrome oxidase Cu insertion factor (SCO1/SenC/PrrC family)